MVCSHKPHCHFAFQKVNIGGADYTARMRRLVCALCERIKQKRVSRE